MSQLTIMINATVRGLGKQAMPDWLADLFQAHGMEGAIWFAHRGPELVALARKAAHQAGETVAAGGSNGTINTVASALLGTNKVLSVLPLQWSKKIIPVFGLRKAEILCGVYVQKNPGIFSCITVAHEPGADTPCP
jgi:hypothetical protein